MKTAFPLSKGRRKFCPETPTVTLPEGTAEAPSELTAMLMVTVFPLTDGTAVTFASILVLFVTVNDVDVLEGLYSLLPK